MAGDERGGVSFTNKNSSEMEEMRRAANEDRSGSFRDYRTTGVIAAIRADPVRWLWRSTFRAWGQRRCFQRQMAASLALTRLGVFSFRKWGHGYFLDSAPDRSASESDERLFSVVSNPSESQMRIHAEYGRSRRKIH